MRIPFLAYLFTAILIATAWASPAFSRDLFAVSVYIDSTGDNVVDARTKALNSGQARAIDILLERLTLPEHREKAGIGILNHERAAPLIAGMDFSNEKRSSQRYIANVTINFDSPAVENFLAAMNIPMVTSRDQKRLLIPLLEGKSLWAENDWWREWNRTHHDHELAPLIVFESSIADAAILDPEALEKRKISELKPLASHYGTDQIIVAQARPGASGPEIILTEIDVNKETTRVHETLSAQDWRSAVRMSVDSLQNDWKRSVLNRRSAGSRQIITVRVLFDSLQEWQRMKRMISTMDSIRNVRMDALTKKQAYMTWSLEDNPGAVARALSFQGVNFELEPSGGWVAKQSGR